MSYNKKFKLYDLTTIIEKSYTQFSKYKLKKSSLDVCRCNCCMDEETEKLLLTTSLKNIGAHLLCEFTNSAHGEGQQEELKFFLPRYFEVLANGEDTSWLGTWLSLSRLAEFKNWQLNWPKKEVLIIEEFLDSLLWHSTIIDSKQSLHWDEILVMLASVNHNPCDILKEILNKGNKKQITSVLNLCHKISNDLLNSNYWSDYREINKEIVFLIKSDLSLTAGLKALEISDHRELDSQISDALDFLTMS